jgi:restriction endonuclease S subunit
VSYRSKPFYAADGCRVVWSLDASILLTKYLYYALKVVGLEQFTTGCTGKKSLALEKFREIAIAVPSIDEQQETIQKLERLEKQLDDAVSERKKIAKTVYEFLGDDERKVDKSIERSSTNRQRTSIYNTKRGMDDLR